MKFSIDHYPCFCVCGRLKLNDTKWRGVGEGGGWGDWQELNPRLSFNKLRRKLQWPKRPLVTLSELCKTNHKTVAKCAIVG